MPPGHPCLFPFLFFSSFFLSPLPFSVIPFLLVFVFSFRCFPLASCISPSSFSFRFSSLLGGGFCNFVSVLHPPPRCLRPCKSAYYTCVLSPCVLALFYLLPFFNIDLDVVCFILSFSCGYDAASSVSVSVATRLAYDTRYISDTCVR